MLKGIWGFECFKGEKGDRENELSYTMTDIRVLLQIYFRTGL